MKKVTCIERLYRIDENNETKYFIQLRRELSADLTTELLHEDMEIKTFLGICEIILPEEHETIIETVKIPDVDRQRQQSQIHDKFKQNKSEISRVEELITKLYKDGKDFSSPELAEKLKLEPRRAKDIIQILKKHKFVKRSNPEVKEKRQFRWTKNDNVNTEPEPSEPEPSKPEELLELTESSPLQSQPSTIEENILKIKDAIRDFYREGKDFSANDLYDLLKISKKQISYILYKLHNKEHYIKVVNPTDNRNRYRYAKAEAMIAPEHVRERNMAKLLEERKLTIDQLS